MKYNRDEALDEIFKRGKAVKHEQTKKRTRILEAASFLLVFSLVGVIGTLSGAEAGEGAQTLYGASILSEEAGGYLLVAGIAFVLGIVITLTLQHVKKRSMEGKDL